MILQSYRRICCSLSMEIRVPVRCFFHHIVASAAKPTFRSQYLRLQSFSTRELPGQRHDKNLVSLSNILRRYGFKLSEIHNFLAKNRFLLDYNFHEIKKSLDILLSLKPCQEFLFSIVYSCPRVLDFGFLKQWEVGISDVRISNITALQLGNVLEVSTKFNLGPDDVTKCIECLHGLEFSDSTISKLLKAWPMVLVMNEDKIRVIMEVFMRIGIERNKIDSIFNLFPSVLVFGFEMKLRRLLVEFKDLGFSINVVRKMILTDPKILGLEVGELSRCVRLLGSLKCRQPIKEKIFREGPFRAAYEVKLRVDCLHRYGLMYREAFSVLWKEPSVITYGIRDIEEKIEFLIHKMHYDVQCLVEVPEYLSVNFAKQIVPRFNVVEYLRSKGGLGQPIDLRALIKPSRLKFYNLYVKPYPECEKIYGRFAGAMLVRNWHPTGMWKLFKPQKYPESKEDVKNIKCFMEELR